MNKATAIYLVVLLLSAAALWLILRAGSNLRAPTDLSGSWEIGGEEPATLESLGDTVSIEQSGQFFQLRFERGLTIDLRLVDATSGGLLFAGAKWQLNAIGQIPNGPFIFRLTGPQRHTFTVSRAEDDSNHAS
jgi:hypothetical protein